MIKVTCRDGGWAVGAEPSLLLNAHFNQEELSTSSTEMFWTFGVRNHLFCPGTAKAGSWEWNIRGNGWGEGLEYLSTLSAHSQSWHPHCWLWWQGDCRGAVALGCPWGVSSLTHRPLLRVTLLPSVQNGNSDASTTFAKSFERLVSLLQMLRKI